MPFYVLYIAEINNLNTRFAKMEQGLASQMDQIQSLPTHDSV